MKYRTYQKISTQLLEKDLDIGKSFILQSLNNRRDELRKKSLKAINLKLSFCDDGDDFTRGRKTVIWDMDVYKMPRIVKRLHV